MKVETIPPTPAKPKIVITLDWDEAHNLYDLLSIRALSQSNIALAEGLKRHLNIIR